MKLFVKSKATGQKHYLRETAANRKELASKIGGQNFRIGEEFFSINDVQAERKLDNVAVAMALGGVMGIVGGPVGVITGTIIGGFLGNGVDKKEIDEIELFNRSML